MTFPRKVIVGTLLVICCCIYCLVVVQMARPGLLLGHGYEADNLVEATTRQPSAAMETTGERHDDDRKGTHAGSMARRSFRGMRPPASTARRQTGRSALSSVAALKPGGFLNGLTERKAAREASAKRLKARQPKLELRHETPQRRAEILCAPFDSEQVEALKLYIALQHVLADSHASMVKATRQWCSERGLLDGNFKPCLKTLLELELEPDG